MSQKSKSQPTHLLNSCFSFLTLSEIRYDEFNDSILPIPPPLTTSLAVSAPPARSTSTPISSIAIDGMAPAGGKKGLTRMDAALEHLSGMGFKKPDIRRKVRELLKVYGGDVGWVAIEEASYQLLLETLLEEGEGSQPDVPLPLLDEEDMNESIGTSSRITRSRTRKEEAKHGDAGSSSTAGNVNVIAIPVLEIVEAEKSFTGGGSHQESAVTSLIDDSFTVHDDINSNTRDVLPPFEEHIPLEIRHPTLPQPPPPRNVMPPPPSLSPPPPPPPPLPPLSPPPPPPPPSSPPPLPPSSLLPPPPLPPLPPSSLLPPPPPLPPSSPPPVPPPPPPPLPTSSPPPVPSPPSSPPPPSPLPKPKSAQRRKPCYGWWGAETEIIQLPPMPTKEMERLLGRP